MKKLNELLQYLPDLGNLKLTPAQLNSSVTGITSDSREVQPGSVFVAVPGGSLDGHQYIDSAVQQGAVLILGEQDLQKPLAVPYLKVPSRSRSALAALAAGFYGFPSDSLLLIGVTGTSGKTTTTYLIESILSAAGHRVGVVGTVNFRFGSKIFPSTHTTPGAVELQKLLSDMKAEGCTAVVMEVSSHALKQMRVDSLAFDAMVFTNLSPEHLDFHSDMEDYFQSKGILFHRLAEFAVQRGKRPVAAINRDDPYGQRLIQEIDLPSKEKKFVEVRGFHTHSQIQVTLKGIQGEIDGVSIRSHLTGQFNCSNIAAAVAVTQGLRVRPEAISTGILRLAGVPGRLERVENSLGIHVWVDYAHKPDALEKVVKTLRAIRGDHRLITVFGCGGDRDRKKRPVMGRIAVEWSDHVYITSDNPRTENPHSIIQEILVGTQGFNNFSVEEDRKKAIHSAIASAQSGDLVLIAGKGHEDYQILGTKKVHFDDREVAHEAILLRCS